MPDKPHEDFQEGLAQLLKDFLRKKQEYENTKIKCGFVGRAGVGKSSLINAVIGQRLAPTGGHKQVTAGATEYIHGGLHLVDLPGCGVPGFPTDRYVSQLVLDTYDLFIFVTDLRFYKDDVTVYTQLVHELHKPCFLVRTKFDRVLQDAVHDGDDRTEKEIRAEIESDIRTHIREQMPAHQIEKIYMVSARRPDLYDLAPLLDDLRSSFDGVKRIRLENDLAAWSKSALDRKRDNAMQITTWYAAVAALNGLNPVPGLGIAVDVAILKKLANEVAHIYSLSHEQEDFWKGILKGAHATAILQRMVALGAKYGTAEAILMLLKAIGRSEIPREFARWIPILGQMVSAGAGAGLTYTFGKRLVDDYHKLATDLLDELRSEEGLG